MFRRSISCMLAGLMIVGPVIISLWAWEHPEWQPGRIVAIILIVICIAGIIWLFDEIRDIPRQLTLVKSTAGKGEVTVMEGMPSEPEDLVDVFYVPLVRPLGNLVILFAQAEAAWLELVAELTGCTERQAQSFLQMPAADVKQKIVPLAQISGIDGFALKELSEGVDNYYCDRERRHRLTHDEWFVSVLKASGAPMTRGLPRRKGSHVVWGDSKPEDVWKLAWRFRDYDHLFSHMT
jgi:hypothetical protein